MSRDRLSPLAILTTGTESLDDVLFAARMSCIAIQGEPIAFDLKQIVPGGSRVLREVLRTDIRAARLAQWSVDKDLATETMGPLAEKFRRVVWFTWRAYRAAKREEDAVKEARPA